MFSLTKEGITATVRTLMGYVYGFVLTTFAFELPAEVEASLTVVVGTGIYMLIRELAERWSWIGYLLIVNKAPSYEEDLAA